MSAGGSGRAPTSFPTCSTSSAFSSSERPDRSRAPTAACLGADQVSVCAILSARSDGQLRAVAGAYQSRYHRSLLEVVEKSFSGHMKDALVYILRAAMDRARLDADMIEAAMAGMGTKDVLLVDRVVALHWNRERMGQAKAAYRHFYKKELGQRIRGETKGDYERLMVALVEGV